MNWFTRLFRRKPKPEPEPDVEFEPQIAEKRDVWPKDHIPAETVTPTVAESRKPSGDITPKPGGDIIGRQGGQKRNRTHIYRQPFGYPIRLCDWIPVDMDSIEYIGEVQGLVGPAQPEALVMALEWAESMKKAVICKHCLALAQGKREPLMGGPGGYA